MYIPKNCKNIELIIDFVILIVCKLNFNLLNIELKYNHIKYSAIATRVFREHKTFPVVFPEKSSASNS